MQQQQLPYGYPQQYMNQNPYQQYMPYGQPQPGYGMMQQPYGQAPGMQQTNKPNDQSNMQQPYGQAPAGQYQQNQMQQPYGQAPAMQQTNKPNNQSNMMMMPNAGFNQQSYSNNSQGQQSGWNMQGGAPGTQ